MNKIVFLLLVSVLFLGCSQSGRPDLSENITGAEYRPEQEILKVDISDPENNPGIVKTSEIFQSVQYIPLETKDNCLIERIQKVEHILPYIIVSTSQNVLLFDMNGRFIRQIGDEGNGPGEYNSISDICISREDTSIYVASILNRRILRYSINGDLLDSYSNPLPEPVQKIHYFNNNLYLSYGDYVTRNADEEKPVLVSVDPEMNIKTKYSSSVPYKEKTNITLFLPYDNLYCTDGGLRFKQARNDTLYMVTEKGLVPYMIFDLGEKKMPLEEFTYESFRKRIYGDKYILFEKLVGTQAIAFLTYKYDNREIKSIYLKRQRTLKEPMYSGSVYNFIDDLNRGLPFWPESLSGDKYLIGWLFPVNLTESQLKDIPCSGTYVAIDDNPVIQLAILK